MRVFLFLLVVLLAVDITLAADSVDGSVHTDRRVEVPISLEGKRLFFDVHQRASTETLVIDQEDAVLNDESYGGADSASEGDHAPDARIRQQRTSTYIDVRYDARVESENYFRIIVNGAPCDPVERLLPRSERPGRYLACSLPKESDLQLLLLADGKRVQVIRNEEVVGILTLGQEL